MTSTGVVTTTGHCAIHGYHGMSGCPKCSTGIPQPLPVADPAITSAVIIGLNDIADALHRIADALEKENP